MDHKFWIVIGVLMVILGVSMVTISTRNVIPDCKDVVLSKPGDKCVIYGR